MMGQHRLKVIFQSCRRLNKLKELDLRSCGLFTELGLRKSLLDHATSLHKLTVADCFFISEGFLTDLSGHLPSLEHIRLNGRVLLNRQAELGNRAARRIASSLGGGSCIDERYRYTRDDLLRIGRSIDNTIPHELVYDDEIRREA